MKLLPTQASWTSGTSVSPRRDSGIVARLVPEATGSPEARTKGAAANNSE